MLNLVDLTPDVRGHMLGEVLADQSIGEGFISPRLTETGVTDYPGLLREAVTSHDGVWLTNELNDKGRLKTQEERRTKNGVTLVKVPHTAAETLAVQRGFR